MTTESQDLSPAELRKLERLRLFWVATVQRDDRSELFYLDRFHADRGPQQDPEFVDVEVCGTCGNERNPGDEDPDWHATDCAWVRANRDGDEAG